MEHAGFVVCEHRVFVGEKTYTIRNCTPKLPTSEYENRKKQVNDKLYALFCKYVRAGG